MSIPEIEHVRRCIGFDSGSMPLNEHDRAVIAKLIDEVDRALLVLRIAGGPAPAVQSALVVLDVAFTAAHLGLVNDELRDLVFNYRWWLVDKGVLNTPVVTLHAALGMAIARDFADALPIDDYADSLPGWLPRQNHCHDQVMRWLLLNPADHAVRGWMPECQLGHDVRFAAHSLVRTASGKLLDVAFPTPAFKRPFIEHPPEAGDFFALVHGKPPMHYVDVLDPNWR
ncbi:hypothetical protein K7N18_25410 [Burkholderia arboris]|uniref:hypothetical protein n=1 Tax=Burkholderia arboris TaxID=488730 RepID=UPI001CA4324C|nr:hypothetical protein [Burkholderia arboris]MBY8608168.1 hypothetical protein [Burkholderia arboris]